jgi:lysophospholipase L1-like esterase
MKRTSLKIIFILALTTLHSTAISQELPLNNRNPATIPVPRKGLAARHEGFNATAQKGDIELLFIGDSITEGWTRNKTGARIWTEYYSSIKTANFGIGGDKTENVLWRIQNGNLDGINPKVIVLMIGTNNVKRDTAVNIVEGVTAIVREIRIRTPNSKVLLLAIFPRGENPVEADREKITEINTRIASLDDYRHVYYLDIGQRFLSPDGKISKEIMPDFLHLSTAGYKIWADAMQPKLAELMK